MKFSIIALLLLLVLGFAGYQYLSSSVEAAANISVNPIPDSNAAQKEKALTAPSDSLHAFRHDQLENMDSVNKGSIDDIVLSKKDGFTEINWKFLSFVEFKETFNEEMDAYIPIPDFHDKIWALNGKKVSLSGYVIPVEETGDEQILVLSAFPYVSCFFCGNAGPETVMDVKTIKKYKKFKMDSSVKFRGKLKLNDKDLYYLNYILEEAELVED